MNDAFGKGVASCAGMASANDLAPEVMMQMLIAWLDAWETVRDAVLNERHGMADAGFNNDQVNAVLGIQDGKPVHWGVGKSEGW